ncbi:MAG: YcgJ family protein [Geminicoccaceae bacterium]|nr:YcgJ family protein [Geminicoccaceae bacterium]
MAERRALFVLGLALTTAACAPGPVGGGGIGGVAGAGYRDGDRWISPTPGVRCDRYERVCYDRNGPELSLTRDYFGRSAAKDLEDRIGGDWRTDTRYTPKEGVKCDTEDELCLKRGEPDYKNTREQFGRKPALAVTEPDGTIRPGKRTVCDPASQVCEKNDRPSVDRTRFVFGDRAARNLKSQLRD